MPFQVGDVVQLRYGSGPQMKVEKVATSGGNEWVTVVWGANNECHNYFAAEMLQIVRTMPRVAQPQPARQPPTFWRSLLSWFTGR
jgi:uncharacterized protein YodC (DUF2158 family)